MPLPPITLAIRGATLLDGSGAEPLAGATVLVAGERLVAAGPSAQVPVPEGAETIDGTGRWIIPGLVDMHVHVNNTGPESLPLWLANGVTTIRDIGGDIDTLIPWRVELAAGARVGPRLFTYGPMIDGAPATFAGNGFDRLWVEVDSPAAGEAQVDRLLAAGVDGFKLYQNLPVDILRAMIRRVDGRVPVTSHLTRTRASDAIVAGLNCMEHNFVSPYNDVCRPEDRTPEGWGLRTPGFMLKVHEGWSRADLTAPHARAFIETLAASGVYYDPTASWGTAGFGLEETEEESGSRYLTPTMVRRREMQAQRMRAQGQQLGRAAGMAGDPALMRASAEKQLEMIGRVHEAGGLVLAGTDTGAVQVNPGFGLHRELRWLALAGIPPRTIIQIATRRAAEALRRADDQGTIRPGQRADMVLLDADPLADIRNTRRIHRTIKDGRAYDPVQLLSECEREYQAANERR